MNARTLTGPLAGIGVVVRVAEGAGNAQIAWGLGLSMKTVQNYVSRILDRPQVADRTQAALRARAVRDARRP